MNYALVENGNVTSIGLPQTGTLKNGNTVSGYNLLDEETLLVEGWLPFIDEVPVNTETFIQDGYIIENNRVLQKYKSIGIDSYRQDKINHLWTLRTFELESGFTSSAYNDTPIEFDYSQLSQDRFTKQATLISINPSITQVNWGTKYNGFIQPTRAQFINILNDAANHELDLEFKYLYARAHIQNSTTQAQVDTIVAGW